MTTLIKDSGRLAWLAATLGEQRGIIASLVGRLTWFGAPGEMKFSLFRKFLRTLEHIAREKDREMEIIYRIQSIEKYHRFQRDCGKLKMAVSGARIGPELGCEIPEEPEQSSGSWHAVMGLVCLLSHRELKPSE